MHCPNGRKVLKRLGQKRYPRTMDTRQLNEQKRREYILAFWKEHGPAATKDAFNVCERTLYRWQNDPVPKSRIHRTGYAKRQINPVLASEILNLRSLHPRLGKEKLTPLLQAFCAVQGINAPSEPTVGRMLAQLKAEGRLPSGRELHLHASTGRLIEKPQLHMKKKVRRGSYLPEKPGDLLQLDGVLIFALRQRRYTFTAVDLVSRWAFSKTYKTASSRNGADFLQLLLMAAPFKIRRIQTDNGSEFLKEFREAAEKAGLTHFFNWVKQPKYQGWVERFNRSIQEEFLNYHRASLAGEPDDFNPELTRWLEFYNGQRVHRSLGRPGQHLTPLQYLAVTKD